MAKNCLYCHLPLIRAGRRKFCNAECYRAYGRQHAARDEGAKRNRRNYLRQRYINEIIDWDEFRAQWKLYEDEGLI